MEAGSQVVNSLLLGISIWYCLRERLSSRENAGVCINENRGWKAAPTGSTEIIKSLDYSPASA
jgi:hypothetical protein